MSEHEKTSRNPEYPINPLLLNRHSSRAMSGEPMSDEELMPLFEAAKWAPSGMNNQLWRFIYAKRETKYWDDYFNLLMDGNKLWCKNASVLVILISRKHSYNNNHPQRAHSFEAGSAFENLAIEGVSRGYSVRCLGGIHHDAAHSLLKLSDAWRVECMIAIGKKGKVEDLPQELQARETPNDRKKLNELVFEGEFNEN